jgi:HAD superfamily hydrolase (TIGR01490 family)
VIAAIFDIDGTIVKINSQQEFARLLRKKGLFTLLDDIVLSLWFFLFKMNLISSSEPMRKRAYKRLKSLSINQFNEWCRLLFEEKLKASIRPSIMKAIQYHKSQGHELIAVSGSIKELCVLIASFLGIGTVYATSLSSDGVQLLGKSDGQILEGPERLKFIEKVSQERNIDLSQSFYYADNLADLPLLRRVGHPCVVCPSRALKSIAEKNHWRIING